MDYVNLVAVKISDKTAKMRGLGRQAVGMVLALAITLPIMMLAIVFGLAGGVEKLTGSKVAGLAFLATELVVIGAVLGAAVF